MTERQTDRKTGIQTDGKKDRHGRRSDRQARSSLNDIKTYRQTGKQTDRETAQKTDRQTLCWAYRQTERHTDRQTCIHAIRQACRQKKIDI